MQRPLYVHLEWLVCPKSFDNKFSSVFRSGRTLLCNLPGSCSPSWVNEDQRRAVLRYGAFAPAPSHGSLLVSFCILCKPHRALKVSMSPFSSCQFGDDQNCLLLSSPFPPLICWPFSFIFSTEAKLVCNLLLVSGLFPLYTSKEY